MKKILLSILALFIFALLGGCQTAFDPQTALQESRAALNGFTKLYSGDEKVLDAYNKEELTTFFMETEKDYFSSNFKENVLPDKLNNLTFDDEKDFSKISKQFLFLTFSSEEKGVFWIETELLEDAIDVEKETASFYVSPSFPSYPSHSVEMIKKDGKWKINTILEPQKNR